MGVSSENDGFAPRTAFYLMVLFPILEIFCTVFLSDEKNHNDVSTRAAAMGIRVPLSQTLFSVAEVSKQDICVPRKCRESPRALLTGFLLRWLPAP